MPARHILLVEDDPALSLGVARALEREGWGVDVLNDGEQAAAHGLIDQFDLLYEEAAKHGGRIMSVMLHPWAIGQPYRIGTLERALAHFMRHPGVWPATGSEILDAWRKQQ